MNCPTCRNPIGGDGVCGVCTPGAPSRPTIFGHGAPGAGFFCAHCGARKVGPAWRACEVCGAAAPGVTQPWVLLAGALIALLALLAAAAAIRMSPVPPVVETHEIYQVAPVPVEQPTIVIRSSVFSSSQDRWEMTSITQTAGRTEVVQSVQSPVVTVEPCDGQVGNPCGTPAYPPVFISSDPTSPQLRDGQIHLPEVSREEIVASPVTMEMTAPVQGSTYNQ